MPAWKKLLVAAGVLLLVAVVALGGFFLNHQTVSGGSAHGTKKTATISVAPGGSLETAYQQAAPGDTVCLQTGSWPYQQLAYDAAKGAAGAAVTFAPCAGATPVVDAVDFGNSQLGVKAPSNVTLQNLTVKQTTIWDGASNDKLVNVTGRNFDILSDGTSPPNNIQVLGGDYGPCQAPRDGACTVRLIGTNILVDGAHIHGATSTDLVNYHVDGMFIRGCQGCTVKNSVFDGNMITNVRVQNCCGLAANSNVTFDHNNFGLALDGSGNATRADAVDVDTNTPGIVFTNNLIYGFVQWAANGPGTLTGNLMTNDGCLATLYAGNTEKAFSQFWRNTACAGDTLVTPAAWDTAAAAWLAGTPPPPTTTATTTTTPTTTASTTTATTTTAPTTTSSGYNPACAPTCDQQVATLQTKLNAANTAVAALQARIAKATLDLAG